MAKRWIGFGARAGCALAAGMAAALLAPGARAEEPDKTDHSIEEVVVTARKRAENIQQTPIAISAQTGLKLEEAGVTNLAEASRFVPNVSFTKGGVIAGNSSAAVAFIRGVGQSDFIITSDPGVGIYIDGIYHARMVGAASELVDVERVEVLRGPQGTLFGRNAIGGAINIITAEPQPDVVTSSASVTAGENDHYAIKVGGNFPLSEELAVRVNLMRRQRGGYVEALQYDGNDFGDDDFYSGRVASRFERGAFKGVLSVDYTNQKEFGAGWVAEQIVAPGTDPTFTQLFPTLANNAVGGACTTTIGQQTDPSCFGPVQETNDPYKSNNVFEDTSGRKISPYSTVRNGGVGFTAETDIGSATLKSITSWRQLKSGFTRSLSHGTVKTFNNNTVVYDSDQYSQELQLSGSGANGVVDWVTGLYYFGENAIEIDDLATSAFDRKDDTFKVRNRSLAGLANVTAHFTDALDVTLGARLTDDLKIGKAEAPRFEDPPGTPDPTFLDATLRSRRWTPSANASYRFTPDVMGYASYSQGYKVGTFAPRLPFPNLITQLPTSKPEFLTSYEIGVKSDFFDDRLRFNVSAFHGQYDDIQINYTPAGQPNPVVGNVASAFIRGLEFELQALLTDDLQLTGALGLLDAQYQEFDTLPTVFFDKRTRLERTPHYQGSLGLNYTFALPRGALQFGVDWTLTAKQALAADSAGRPFNIERAWNSGNLSIGYLAPGDKWSLTFFVDNLTDEAHRVGSGDDTREFFGLAESLYVRPREFYATLKYNFK